jgi:hypothetical protein
MSFSEYIIKVLFIYLFSNQEFISFLLTVLFGIKKKRKKFFFQNEKFD